MITVIYNNVLIKDYYEYQDVIRLIKELEKSEVLTINKEISTDILKKNSRFL